MLQKKAKKKLASKEKLTSVPTKRIRKVVENTKANKVKNARRHHVRTKEKRDAQVMKQVGQHRRKPSQDRKGAQAN